MLSINKINFAKIRNALMILGGFLCLGLLACSGDQDNLNFKIISSSDQEQQPVPGVTCSCTCGDDPIINFTTPSDINGLLTVPGNLIKKGNIFNFFPPEQIAQESTSFDFNTCQKIRHTTSVNLKIDAYEITGADEKSFKLSNKVINIKSKLVVGKTQSDSTSLQVTISVQAKNNSRIYINKVLVGTVSSKEALVSNFCPFDAAENHIDSVLVKATKAHYQDWVQWIPIDTSFITVTTEQTLVTHHPDHLVVKPVPQPLGKIRVTAHYVAGGIELYSIKHIVFVDNDSMMVGPNTFELLLGTHNIYVSFKDPEYGNFEGSLDNFNVLPHTVNIADVPMTRLN